MDGFRVMSMNEAAKIGDVFCTVTGNKSVLAKEHFEVMKDGAIICNSGPLQRRDRHSGAGEDVLLQAHHARLSSRSTRCSDGRKINLLGEGRLINLAAAEGHPPSVMDMSFADQALSVEYMVKNHKTLEKKVYKVPEELDKRVAQAEAGVAGHQDRPPDAGAGRVPGELVGRNLTQLEPE